MLLDGKRLLITGVLTDDSIAFAVARAAQHALCQCRRSSAETSSAGQQTRCGTPGRISWSQPGQR